MNQSFNESAESMTTRDPHQRALEDEVARLVVDALLRCGLNPSQCERSPASTSDQVTVAKTNDAEPHSAGMNDLMIDANVISVHLLSTLAIGDRRLAFSENAVITPAAKDWLREKKVAWCLGVDKSQDESRVTMNAVPQTRKTAWLYDSDHPEQAIGFAKQLSMRGIATTAVQSLAEISEEGLPGLVLSSLPAVDVDALGRGQGYRVAAVDSLASIAKIAASLAPQIWIIDKSRLPFQGRVSVAVRCIRASLQSVSSSHSTSMERRR